MFKTIVTGLVITASFVTLISLGLWQVNRLQWKTNILNDIAAVEAIDATQTPLNLSNTVEFERGYINGRFLTDKHFIQLVPRTNNGMTGYHLISPFQTNDGHIILVNQGFVANTRVELPLMHSTSNTVAGYIKTPDAPNSFTPQNRSKDNQWYWLDITAISAFYDLPLHDKVLYMQSPISTEPLTFDGMPKPRNKHLQYAVFWFGMTALLGILLVFRFIMVRRQQS